MPALDRSLSGAVCFVYTCRRLIDLSLIAGTGKYTEKSKTEKCSLVSKAALKRPSTISGITVSKAALVRKLDKGLTWNEFQREAVLAGYPNGNSLLGDAWRYYRNPGAISIEES